MKTAIIYDKWLSGLGGGEVVACTMATSLRDVGYKVILVSKDSVSQNEIKSKLGIDLIGIKITNDLTILNSISKIPNPNQIPNPKFQTPNTNFQSPVDLFINLSFMDYSYGFAKKNIYYVHFPSPIRSGLFNYVLLFFQKTKLHNLFPKHLKEQITDRLRAGIFSDMKKRLDSYDLFITHSKYVSKWTKTYWNKDAKVLYPPVQLLTSINTATSLSASQRSTTKHNWICSLGRFFTLGHGKKQEIMIETFKQLYDSLKSKPQTLNPKQISNSKLQISNNQSPISNLQLHLIGGVGNEPSSLRFIDKLKHMAKGYPIFFHFNASREEVEDILLKSKVYWHAAGYGEDPNKDPIKFEHFGIAPIEAISAGCIPILFDGGGLREIVEILHLDPKCNLFSTIEDLVENTKQILAINNIFISQNTTELLNKHFSHKQFSSQLLTIIEDSKIH